VTGVRSGTSFLANPVPSKKYQRENIAGLLDAIKSPEIFHHVLNLLLQLFALKCFLYTKKAAIFTDVNCSHSLVHL
jgi:hypothetical protein